MNKTLISILVIATLFMVVGCDSNKNNIQYNNDNNEVNNSNEAVNTMKVTINNKQYTIDLDDNETTKNFVNLLPQELYMIELNGNEKYVYLDSNLPTDSSNPKHINSGDVMLYGNNCLVIFYKSFDTNYSYTKIGHIDNLDNLGSENIMAIFER